MEMEAAPFPSMAGGQKSANMYRNTVIKTTWASMPRRSGRHGAARFWLQEATRVTHVGSRDLDGVRRAAVTVSRCRALNFV